MYTLIRLMIYTVNYFSLKIIPERWSFIPCFNVFVRCKWKSIVQNTLKDKISFSPHHTMYMLHTHYFPLFFQIQNSWWLTFTVPPSPHLVGDFNLNNTANADTYYCLWVQEILALHTHTMLAEHWYSGWSRFIFATETAVDNGNITIVCL